MSHPPPKKKLLQSDYPATKGQTKGKFTNDTPC